MSTCTSCSSVFTIHPQEAAFLEKIDLPHPSLCPACRMQGRFAWRNERRLYHRKCDLTGKQIISIYAPDSPYIVYDQHEWNGDGWDGMDSGRDFDFSRPFFQQFDDLLHATPKISVFTSQNVNSDFTNGTQQDKDCYMIFVSDHDEDCYYSYSIFNCKDCLECLNCFKCELCVECVDCSDSHNLAYCERSHNCIDSFFLSDCKGCTSCFGCFGLRNKQYYIFNEKQDKETYVRKLQELNTGNERTLRAARDAFLEKASTQQIHQYYDGNGNENVTGDHIIRSNNCVECFDSGELRDCGHLIFSYKSRDCYDGHVVVDNCELCYSTISTVNQYNTQFAFVSLYSKNGQYLDHCMYCEDCFGCSALKRKRFCIFNKQYTEEEYGALKAKIIAHMKQTGEWGQPLPPQLSPFGYNETVAQEYFPLTEGEVIRRGWRWYEDKENQTSAYQGALETIPVDIRDVPDMIVDRILTCERSGKPFKIIKQELEMYRRHHLPLPRMCFDERHLERIRRRNPRTLWKRECQKCNMPIATSYSPERPEIVYCEKCYLQEVY